MTGVMVFNLFIGSGCTVD